MQRRQFVQTLAAGSALGSLGLMTGCASTGGGSGPHVVVVGGGFGGATAAKYIKRANPAVDVVLSCSWPAPSSTATAAGPRSTRR